MTKSNPPSGITIVHVDALATGQTPLTDLHGSMYPIDVTANRSNVVEWMGATDPVETRVLRASAQTGDSIALLTSGRERF